VLALVTGAARSGTSVTTQILAKHGMHTGHVNDLWEGEAVREKVVKRYLREIKADPMGQAPLPALDERRMPKWNLAQEFFHYLGVGKLPTSYLYKGAKVTLMWWVWHAAFPDAKWIIVRRDRSEIIDSCNRCHFMTKTKDWGAWVDHHVAFFDQIKSAVGTANYREIWPHQFLSGDTGAIKEAVAWLGMEWNPAHLKDSINPKLFRRSR